MNVTKPTIRVIHAIRWGCIPLRDGMLFANGFVDERCWQCGVLPYGDMYEGKTPEQAYENWLQGGDTDRS